jgi:low affinity Fe/Cu permease
MIDHFARFSRLVARWLAHPAAFVCALLSVLAWALCGPVFGYSEAWQLVINTGTTIATFLMVFLLQNTQNRDSKAMQVKLDELIRALKGARNELIDLENFTEEELERYTAEFGKIHRHYAAELDERRTGRERKKPATKGSSRDQDDEAETGAKKKPPA